jgi:hypothetical protein
MLLPDNVMLLLIQVQHKVHNGLTKGHMQLFSKNIVDFVINRVLYFATLSKVTAGGQDG